MVSPLGDAIALLAGLGAACYLSLAEKARRGLDPLVFFSLVEAQYAARSPPDLPSASAPASRS